MQGETSGWRPGWPWGVAAAPSPCPELPWALKAFSPQLKGASSHTRVLASSQQALRLSLGRLPCSPGNGHWSVPPAMLPKQPQTLCVPSL